MNKNIDTVYSEFIGISPVSKTLRNELRPVGYTEEYIRKNGIIQEDEVRLEKSYELKDLMDDYYRDYIDKKLSNVSDIEFDVLFDLIGKVQNNTSNDNKKTLEKEQSKIREQIYNHLQSDPDYKNMFNAKIIKNILPDYVKNSDKYDDSNKIEKLKLLALFEGFSTYFTSFFENRKNVFSKENKSTSLSYRIVNENALIYSSNIAAYEHILEKAGNEIQIIEKENQDRMDDWKLSQIFTPDFYNMLMVQSGIDFYNEICGAVNAHMNLYSQQTKNNYSVFKMRKLHKQMLAHTSTSFEVPKMFEDDLSVYNAVNEFIDKIEDVDGFNRLTKIANELEELDAGRIYISKDYYETISCFMCGNWNLITNCLEKFYNENIFVKGKSKDEKVKKQ